MLRIDDIPQRVADDIHALGVIGCENSSVIPFRPDPSLRSG